MVRAVGWGASSLNSAFLVRTPLPSPRNTKESIDYMFGVIHKQLVLRMLRGEPPWHMELGPFVADHDVCHGAEEREEEDDEEDEGDDDDEPPPLGDWWAE